MRARQAASGFVGVIFLAAFTCVPTLVARKATAALEARSARTTPRGHGIVQVLAENVPVPPACANDLEHSESKLHVEPAPFDAPVASAAPSGAPASAKTTTPSASAAAAAPALDDVDLKRAIALQVEMLPICRRPGGPEGPGMAEVTFTGEGRARVGLSAPYANTSVGACVARRLANAAVPFDGEPITVRVRFEL